MAEPNQNRDRPETGTPDRAPYTREAVVGLFASGTSKSGKSAPVVTKSGALSRYSGRWQKPTAGVGIAQSLFSLGNQDLKPPAPRHSPVESHVARVVSQIADVGLHDQRMVRGVVNVAACWTMFWTNAG